MATIRRKPSGRYEVRYRDPRGRLRGKTFATKAEARRYVNKVGTSIGEGTYRDPALGRMTLREYAKWWMANRPELRPRTVEVYRSLLTLHVLPALGDVRFERLTGPVVRVGMSS